MQGNCSYYNPTKLYFGEDALKYLSDELRHYGPTVQLCYGGGSIKRNGIYDAVVSALKEAGKTIVEDAGVMPNPTIEKLHEGARMARENNVDLILAVGGGSTIDYAKGVACSAWLDGDPWQTYYMEQQEATCRVIPVGSVLTMVGTGSEMNGGSVITNRSAGMKIGKVFGPYAYPKFTVLNPRFTFTVPQYQMVAGFFDIMSHIMEQYFSGDDDNTTDYLAEGLIRSLVQPHCREESTGLRGPLEHHVDGHLGTEHTHCQGQEGRLDGTHDWPGHRCPYRCHAWHDALSCLTALLQVRQPVWPEEVCPLCRECLGCLSRRQERATGYR